MKRKSILTHEELETDNILLLLKNKYELKVKKNMILEEIREKRTVMYNISKSINELEETIDKKIIKRFSE